MHGEGACMAKGGVHGKIWRAWEGGHVWRVCVCQEACVAGGILLECILVSFNMFITATHAIGKKY